jgi:hypothetical protein
VRVVFSDESSPDSGGPDVVVAAIMANLDSQWPHLPQEIEKLIEDQKIDPQTYELKGATLFRDISKAKRHPCEKHDRFAKRARALLGGCLATLLKHEIPIVCGAINKAGFATLQKLVGTIFRDVTAYRLAFGTCLRDADTYIHTSTKEPMLWISDENQVHKASLESALQATRIMERWNWRAAGATDIPAPEPHFVHIAETICFANSERSRLVQLADVCATIIALEVRLDSTARPFFNLLLPLLKSQPRSQFANTSAREVADALRKAARVVKENL